MGIIATTVELLIAAGVSGDALVEAVAALDSAADRRSTGAKRQARYRARLATQRQAPQEASQSVTRDDGDASDAPPNDIYSNPLNPYLLTKIDPL